jgi:undecaprenyl-diphosphatase
MSRFSKKEVLAMAVLAGVCVCSYLSGLDYWLARTLSQRSPIGISLFISTAYYAAYILSGVILLFRKNRRAAAALVLSILLLFLMQDAFTVFSPRARPPEAMHIGDWLMNLIKRTGGSSSFFSGHSASSVAVATTYGLLGIHPALMAALAVPILVSRLTLVQHYLSDVIGGIIFGYVTTKIITILLLGNFNKKPKVKHL